MTRLPRSMLRAGTLAVVALGTTPHALAAPEEIQVYMEEMDDPGQIGLDLHNNYVLTGSADRDYPGPQPPLHRYRLTPEFSYGVTHHLELGLYLPLATYDRYGRLGVDGFKFRAKYLVPRAKDAKWFYGANFEIGRVDHKLDPNPWNAELKLIGGRHSGRWILAFNGNIDFKVDGPERAPASFDGDTKLSYAITKGIAIGFETYNGAGAFNRFGTFGRAEQSSFATIDTHFGRWDLNLGVGSAYGSTKDGVIVKAIIGVPLGRARGEDTGTTRPPS